MSETREFTLFQPLYSDGRPIGNGNWKVWNGKAGEMPDYPNIEQVTVRELVPTPSLPDSQEREPDGDLIGWASDEILEVRGHSTTPVTDALHVATKIIMAARKNLATRPEPTDVREALEIVDGVLYSIDEGTGSAVTKKELHTIRRALTTATRENTP